MMSGVFQMRDHLLDELELAVRTTGNLLARIKPEEWDYRPHQEMRTLLEVVHHLVSIPATDLAILQEKAQPDVQAIEEGISQITDAQQLAEQMRVNFASFKQYMQSLTADELLHKSTKAFYMEHGMVQSKWLIEVTTHTFHHRSQLYSYLKQLGHDLNFFVLYG